MAIVFDREFGRVWSDGTTPCVFCSVVRLPSLDELDELAERQLTLIKELQENFSEVFSALDLRHCSLLQGHIALYYITSVVPRQFKAGIVHKAFVVPEEKQSKDIFFKHFTTIAHLPVSIHDTFESALGKINAIRLQSHTKKPKSFFGSLLARL